MMRFSLVLLALAPVFAQSANPVTDEFRAGYQSIKTFLLATAERMPEESYSYRPTQEIEAFGRRVAHIANGNYGTCTGLEGEGKALNAQSRTSKADLIAALRESFAVCDRVMAALTDRNALDMTDAWLGQPPARGPKRSRIGQVDGLLRHCSELYGYMAVYLRLKGIVPPTTQP
jgi:hypothetical protein